MGLSVVMSLDGCLLNYAHIWVIFGKSLIMFFTIDDPFYRVTYYIKWVTTSLTYSTNHLSEIKLPVSLHASARYSD